MPPEVQVEALPQASASGASHVGGECSTGYIFKKKKHMEMPHNIECDM